MSNLEHLYQEMILEHNKNPRHFQEVNPHTHYSHGHNPLCGDDYVVTLRVSSNHVIEEIGFKGDGCAISKASGSLMTQKLKGLTVEEALELKDNFISLITTDEEDVDVGKLIVLKGVKKFPVRVKCALLVWRALEDALTETSDSHEITTE
ncbi:SUF system NifU family Fe-S cluster assembly protein [Candidatus Marinamargulisbacteria bacterium SCGC AG-343-D04]|nr:SUF system NifU family Fe-S cluster assembly protein [Candidatus Marinamargulisbacteria bacterium SCGC AG-343-D04]